MAMAETFITQCPHCSTSFRITDEHLAVANGSVRCGACLQVFSARNHLLNSGSSKAKADPGAARAKTNRTERSPKETARADHDDDFPFEDDPNDNFEEFIFSDDEDLLDDGNDDELDELSDAFLDLSDDAPERRVEPRPQPKPPAQPAPTHRRADYDISPEADDEVPWQMDDEDDDDGVTYQPQSSGSQAAQLAQQLTPSDDFDFSHASGTHGRRWLTLAGIVLLSLTLVGELAWWQADRYARLDPWRGVYQSACDLLGCELPPQQDLANVKPSNVLVRNHPTVANVKLLDAILINQAPFRQPFPTLVLEYTDINGERVADQAFAPQEYLRGELTGIKLMPTNTRIYVSIPFRDPGAAAVNYQLRTAPGPG